MPRGTDNYQYILVDRRGSEFKIKPSDLKKQKGMDPNYPTFDEDLNMDENVHMFNAMFDSNKELMENLIGLWNLDHTPINPDDYECVKLISKEMTNSYDLPVYYQSNDKNKGNLLMPIIYKSDLSAIDNGSRPKNNDNEFYHTDLLSPNIYTFYERIPTELFSSNNIFYNSEYRYLLNCFIKKYKGIFAAEKRYGNTVMIQDSLKRVIRLERADILQIIFNTVSVKSNDRGTVEKTEQSVFSRYVQSGDFFYRLMLDIMIMSKRANLVNDGKCGFDDIYVSPRITERYFVYSKDEIKRLMNQDKLYEEQLKTLEDVTMDLVNSPTLNKTDDEETQDFINKINAQIDSVRPSYVKRKNEENLLPFKLYDDEDTEEDYYILDDYYHNEEIREAIDLAQNDTSTYSDYDERHDRTR